MEKVYCPYCAQSEERPNGVEMLAGETQSFKTKAGLIYITRFICAECQSSSPVGMGKTAQESYEKAYSAALGRCKPMLKPLSWWEAIEGASLIEFRNEAKIARALLHRAFAMRDRIANCDSAIFTTNSYEDLRLLGVDYGKTWRCWLTMPTEAERLAAQWEGPEVPAIAEDEQKEPFKEQVEPNAGEETETPAPSYDDMFANNRIIISGLLENGLIFDHEAYGEKFYTGTLLVNRLSGVADKLPVMIPGTLIDGLSFNDTQPLKMSGQVRTHSRMIDGKNRTDVVVFIQDIAPANSGNDVNEVHLIGNICKPPVFRWTPFGRLVNDFLLAVNRRFGKSSYIPCIAWGNKAKWVSVNLRMGDKVRIYGRLQSREYEKLNDNGESIKRTVCEVSVSQIEKED